MTRGKNTSLDYRHPHRPAPLKALNAAGRLLARAGLQVQLDPGALLAAARRRTGLVDPGPGPLQEPLEALLRSMAGEARLHPLGRVMARENLLRLLGNRLRAQQAYRLYPEIQAQELRPPVVIVGLQRTGTTLLHRLLSCDRRLRWLASWESVNPAPLPARGWRRQEYDPLRPLERAGGAADPRLRAARVAAASLVFLAPDFYAVHPVEAGEPEEDSLLFDFTFYSTIQEALLQVPSYSAWLERQDMVGPYQQVRDLLKFLLWQRPGPERWLLKTPHHMENLEALLQVFPGARVIHPVRDPVRALASLCSMLGHARGVFSDHVDPLEVGRHWSAKTGLMVRRLMEVRERVGEQPFVDVQYNRLVADPLAEVARIYQQLDLELTGETHRAMTSWLRENPQHKHGRHRYRLEDFGLDRQLEQQKFSAYYQRFEIPLE